MQPTTATETSDERLGIQMCAIISHLIKEQHFEVPIRFSLMGKYDAGDYENGDYKNAACGVFGQGDRDPDVNFAVWLDLRVREMGHITLPLFAQFVDRREMMAWARIGTTSQTQFMVSEAVSIES